MAYATLNWLFDNILYVYVVHRLGLLTGGIVMTCLAGTQCAVTLHIYERMGVDWVGAGSLAKLAEIQHPRWWQCFLIWVLKKGDAVIFVALCVLQDAFITTAYFRRGKFGGLSGRDWQIFIGSVLLSNFYWTLRSGAVAATLVGVLRWLTPP